MCRNICNIAAASASPPTAPAALSSRLSVRNCATILRRPAPSADRTAISVRRAVTLASSSPATLLHAISHTTPTAISSANSAGCTSCTSRSCLPLPGRTRVCLPLRDELARARVRSPAASRSPPRRHARAQSAQSTHRMDPSPTVSSLCAAAGPTPRDDRPIRKFKLPGHHANHRVPLPPICTVFPSTLRSPAKLRCHIA